jgi:RimJ/RimL family protein N-acetyltransferase
MPIPVLESARLILRPHRLQDFGDYAALWADPVVTRYIGGRPFTTEECWARFLRHAGHWLLLDYGYWVIEEKASGKFAGEIGFADHKRDLQPSLAGKPEIGWVLAPSVHGQGYATEAARAVIAWGDQHFRETPTACIIHPENLVSIRVAQNCGYQEWQHTTYKSNPAIIFLR